MFIISTSAVAISSQAVSPVSMAGLSAASGRNGEQADDERAGRPHGGALRDSRA